MTRLAARDRGYYEGRRQYTYITDGHEQVQITLTEKTVQRDAISSIREALQRKRQTRIRIEEERQREIECQRVRAEGIRQEREEEQRFEGLKRLAGAWSQCEQLRGFIAAWEHATEAKNGPIFPAATKMDGGAG